MLFHSGAVVVAVLIAWSMLNPALLEQQERETAALRKETSELSQVVGRYFQTFKQSVFRTTPKIFNIREKDVAEPLRTLTTNTLIEMAFYGAVLVLCSRVVARFMFLYTLYVFGKVVACFDLFYFQLFITEDKWNLQKEAEIFPWLLGATAFWLILDVCVSIAFEKAIRCANSYFFGRSRQVFPPHTFPTELTLQTMAPVELRDTPKETMCA